VSKKSVPLSRPDHPDDPSALLSTLREIVLSGRWVEGEYAKSFEQRVAEECGSVYAVATNSGTSALELICEASGFEPSAEIICPSYTFVATANALLSRNLKPVFADIDLNTFNLDVKDVEKKITSKTRAIVLVHQYGIPAETTVFAELCKSRDLILIEDAACGLGSRDTKKCVGTYGVAGILSFHPRKVISTGEGGMILTDDEKLANLARSLGNHGRKMPDRGASERVGHNFRMSEFQAALGLWALDRMDEAVARRTTISNRYENALGSIDGIELTREPKGTRWNRQSYPIRILGERREMIAQELEKMGIETSPGVHPCNMHPYIDHLLHPPRLAATERAHYETLLLPMYSALKADDQDYVITELTSALKRI
jgi:perosamine synthetase